MRLSITLLATLLLVAVLAGPAAAQGKTDLTVALSSFSTEVLDPVLGGHVVKYYMSLMFDYLVGVTPDGQLSKDSGLATRWASARPPATPGRCVRSSWTSRRRHPTGWSSSPRIRP